jgi:hypothetical protein
MFLRPMTLHKAKLALYEGSRWASLPRLEMSRIVTFGIVGGCGATGRNLFTGSSSPASRSTLPKNVRGPR